MKNLVVYNLYTKVLQKHAELLSQVHKIVVSLSNKENWNSEVLARERLRLVDLAKTQKDEALLGLTKSFSS